MKVSIKYLTKDKKKRSLNELGPCRHHWPENNDNGCHNLTDSSTFLTRNKIKKNCIFVSNQHIQLWNYSNALNCLNFVHPKLCTSYTVLKKKKSVCYVSGYMWHVTHDMWQMTCDTCQVTGLMGNTFFQQLSTPALTVWEAQPLTLPLLSTPLFTLGQDSVGNLFQKTEIQKKITSLRDGGGDGVWEQPTKRPHLFATVPKDTNKKILWGAFIALFQRSCKIAFFYTNKFLGKKPFTPQMCMIYDDNKFAKKAL